MSGAGTPSSPSKNSPNGRQAAFSPVNFLYSDFSFAELRSSASRFQPKLNEEWPDSAAHPVADGRNISLEAISHELVKDFPGRFKRWQDAFNLVASISRNFGS